MIPRQKRPSCVLLLCVGSGNSKSQVETVDEDVQPSKTIGSTESVPRMDLHAVQQVGYAKTVFSHLQEMRHKGDLCDINIKVNGK